MSSTSSEVIWLHILHELSIFLIEPTPIYADNTSAIQIGANPVFISELSISSLIVTLFVIMGSHPSSACFFSPLAPDLFTKAMTKRHHSFLTTKLMLLPNFKSMRGKCRDRIHWYKVPTCMLRNQKQNPMCVYEAIL